VSDDLKLLQRRFERERNARKQAEALLEKKSRELFHTNKELQALTGSLEEQILERTKELEEARDSALDANRAKTTFLSTMSHEIRTNKRLELLCLIDSDVPNGLIGDPQRLRQILVNLLGNALKFTTEGYVLLKVNAQASGDDVVNLRIEVNDTGQGIDEVFQKALFMPFTQGKYDISNPQGTGLGLSICKRLAKLMNGDIGLDSEVGKGSSFWVELPFTVRDDYSEAPPLQGRFALYQANELIAPVMKDQFIALGVDVSMASSLTELFSWHRENSEEYQKFIIDIDNLDSTQFDQLYQHVKGYGASSDWLFIRGVNEVKTELSDLIQERLIASTMKPICQ